MKIPNTSFFARKNYHYVLIINYADPKKVKLEIIESSCLFAKLEKYGNAYYSYFGIIPKVNNLNINIFREYFNTDLGSQIIQLSLNGKSTKLKGKISSMLIPKFFMESKMIPSNYDKDLEFLNMPAEKLLKFHPDSLKSMLSNSFPIIFSLSKQFPWHVLSILSYFKNECSKALSNVSNRTNASAIYLNPLIKSKLIKLDSYHIYPKNEEVFVDFNIGNKSEFNLPLEKSRIEKFQ